MQIENKSFYARLTQSPYLAGICHVFIRLLPISIISAFLLLLSNGVDLLGYDQLSRSMQSATVLISQLFPILLITFYSQTIASFKHQLKEGVIISSLVSYFLVCLQWDLMSSDMVVPPNTFLAICIPIAVSFVQQKLSRFNVKAHKSLPSVVESSLQLVVQCIATVICVVFISTVLNHLALRYMPLSSLLPELDPNSLFDAALYELVRNLLWSVGINGHVIFSAYKTEIYQLTEQSVAAYHQFGHELPIFTSNFFDFYSGMGGAGNTFSLVLCMLIFAKNVMYRKLALAVFVLSLFNINEPVIYGLPIMFNPIMILPFIVTPIVGLIIAYAATSIGLVPPISELMSWLTPPLVGGYIGTGSISGMVLQAVILAVGMMIYLPFFTKMEKLSSDSVITPKLNSERIFATPEAYSFEHNRTVVPQLELKTQSQRVVSELQQSGKFVLFYQPQVDIKTGRIVSFEALLRHKGHDGRITPPHFIDDFANLGLLANLDMWVIQEALDNYQSYSLKDGQKLSINISPETFLVTHFASTLIQMVEASELDAKNLELEITEELLIKDETATQEVLTQLKEHGISIALDDFGSGYSSIGYLAKFEFDKVKIDRSLVMNSATSRGRKLLDLTYQIASTSCSQVVVEGVENEDELNLVRQLGIQFIQGFYFCKPQPLAQLPNQLTYELNN